MSPEHEFQTYMKATNPTVLQGSVQYLESRRVWYAALWSILCDFHNLEYDRASLRKLTQEVAKFPKYINQPNN
jgi:hypothetical protein